MSSRSSTTDAPSAAARPDRPSTESDSVQVGRVGRPHGVRGEVVVQVESDNPRRFEVGSPMIAELAHGGLRHLLVEESRPHGNAVVLRFAGVNGREAAHTLAGSVLSVPRHAVPPAPDGTVYFFDLIGCRCSDHKVGDLGEVVDVVEDGGGLLLLVQGPAGTVPVPFVQAFIDTMDLNARTLSLNLPDGLLEVCASTS